LSVRLSICLSVCLPATFVHLHVSPVERSASGPACQHFCLPSKPTLFRAVPSRLIELALLQSRPASGPSHVSVCLSVTSHQACTAMRVRRWWRRAAERKRLVALARADLRACLSPHQVFELGSKAELLAAVYRHNGKDGPLTINLTTDAASDLVLHWGVKKRGTVRAECWERLVACAAHARLPCQLGNKCPCLMPDRTNCGPHREGTAAPGGPGPKRTPAPQCFHWEAHGRACMAGGGPLLEVGRQPESGLSLERFPPPLPRARPDVFLSMPQLRPGLAEAGQEHPAQGHNDAGDGHRSRDGVHALHRGGVHRPDRGGHCAAAANHL
jgi:hypothetical protein